MGGGGGWGQGRCERGSEVFVKMKKNCRVWGVRLRGGGGGGGQGRCERRIEDFVKILFFFFWGGGERSGWM